SGSSGCRRTSPRHRPAASAPPPARGPRANASRPAEESHTSSSLAPLVVVVNGILADEPLECLLGRGLLGVLFRPALSPACLLPVDDGRALEVPLVRRARDVEHRVDGLSPLPRERLLELRLVVDEVRRGVVDPPREGIDDRLLDLLVAVLEEERRQ